MNNPSDQEEGLDLEPIRERNAWLREDGLVGGGGFPKSAAYITVEEDIPLLIAEVERLRAEPKGQRYEGWAIEDDDEWLFSTVQLHDIDDRATLIIHTPSNGGET